MSGRSSDSSNRSNIRFTDELRIKAGDQWDRVIHHRFTKELANTNKGNSNKGNNNNNDDDDDINFKQNVLKPYLIQDHRFLDSFVVLLASIIACVPTLQDRIPGCQFLALITGSENNYFERSFTELGVTKEERSIDRTPNADVTTRFCTLMRDVAKYGHLEEMLAVIVVCEWSYLSWATIVLQEDDEIKKQQQGGSEKLSRINRDDFLIYEWITLHSGTEFESVVNYLRELLDREGSKLKKEEETTTTAAAADDDDDKKQNYSKERLIACEKRFLETIQLEEEFFDHFYTNNKESE
mmetsp:Transcript_67815/g.75907  ORF Transcript_67815/g.75907 Transcript_67815/m.75907 type:complete len:296 (-) Transcript_67815:15-902(-)